MLLKAPVALFLLREYLCLQALNDPRVGDELALVLDVPNQGHDAIKLIHLAHRFPFLEECPPELLHY